MNPLPPAYGWIDDLRPLPRMLQEARKLFGTREVPSSANNPVILGWAKEVGLAKSYNDDAIPWCGLFMAVVAKRAGKPVVEGPLWRGTGRRSVRRQMRPNSAMCWCSATLRALAMSGFKLAKTTARSMSWAATSPMA
jgi:hypothetical protein